MYIRYIKRPICKFFGHARYWWYSRLKCAQKNNALFLVDCDLNAGKEREREMLSIICATRKEEVSEINISKLTGLWNVAEVLEYSVPYIYTCAGCVPAPFALFGQKWPQLMETLRLIRWWVIGVFYIYIKEESLLNFSILILNLFGFFSVIFRSWNQPTLSGCNRCYSAAFTQWIQRYRYILLHFKLLKEKPWCLKV